MADAIPDGTCNRCGELVSKPDMAAHLASCRDGDEPGDRDLFHLAIEGRYRPEFWIHVEVPTAATMTDLDRYLRDRWLDCCGHMSAFTVDDTRYAVRRVADLEERSMEVPLEDVIEDGTTFSHEYDYGTPTELTLRVVDAVRGEPTETPTDHYGPVPVGLLARNQPPDIRCGGCGRPATMVCSIHHREPDAWTCDDCWADHECGEDMFLPVVNSPRVGTCGYGR